MRRPSFCCEQHGAGDTRCQPQEGGESTLARVRRFLALSMGGRSSSSSSSRCKHRGPLPPDPIHAPAHAVHSLLADMKGAGVGVQGVLGRPLEEVMAAHGEDSNAHGVPTLVHLLCCFLLTHGVDYDTLVSEDWCAEEVRTRLLLEREAAGVEPDTQETTPGSDSAVATGLLRLFLDELPHALIPPDVAPLLLQLAADSGVGEEGEDEGVCDDGGGGGGGGGGSGGPPGLCVAVVPRLRRLLHRRLPLHNLCLLRYLAAFIHQLRTGNHNTCPVPVDSLSRVLARVLIGRDGEETHGQSANRLGELLILCYSDIFQNREEIVDDGDDYSDSVSSPGSAGDSREDGLDDVDDDDDDDDADTTTTDTDDFRSPPVSPLKVERPRIPSGLVGLRSAPALALLPPSVSARSNKEVVGDLDSISIRPKVPAYAKDFLDSPADSLASPDDDDLPSTVDEDQSAQSPESSCVSANDYWETGGESEGPGVCPELDDTHEERRLSERSFPRAYPQSSRRNRRRTKKRHHSHSPQDSGSQSYSTEEEKTPSYLSSLTSDDEPTRYNPEAQDVTPCHIGLKASQQGPKSGLSELVGASEPVTSDRGSWGMRDAAHSDSWHRTAPRYSRFDDDAAVQSSWYRSDEDDVMVSPRTSQAFTEIGAPPGQDEHSPPPGQGAVKMLMKNINSIKKKIKRYEEEFEADFGYRPSHSEKMKHKEIKKYMSELSKARKELKRKCLEKCSDFVHFFVQGATCYLLVPALL
ncbi:uncharacterized protein [Panulirus ornatus]|uniref:uncharacterized protein isoform X2 n=1 Tax=Panulirus ornatus TaxID=150431 RepID=UPI003A8A2386